MIIYQIIIFKIKKVYYNLEDIYYSMDLHL